MCVYQRRFFRGGKGGQASLTFYQSTNKIVVMFIPDFVSYISYLYVSNRKRNRYQTDKELVVVGLVNRWRCCLQVGNGGKFPPRLPW